MRKNNPSTAPHRRHQLIDFDPAWLDEKGWMTKIPHPYFTSLGITDPYVSMLVGVRVVEMTRSNVEQVKICKFKIGKDDIWQELPDGNSMSLYHNSGEITIANEEDVVQEKWELLADDRDVEGAHSWWHRSGCLRWVSARIPPQSHPSSCTRFFASLNGHFTLLALDAGVAMPRSGIYTPTLELFRADRGLEQRQIAHNRIHGHPMNRPPNAQEIAFYARVRSAVARSDQGEKCTPEDFQTLFDEGVALLRAAQQIDEFLNVPN